MFGATMGVLYKTRTRRVTEPPTQSEWHVTAPHHSPERLQHPGPHEPLIGPLSLWPSPCPEFSAFLPEVTLTTSPSMHWQVLAPFSLESRNSRLIQSCCPSSTSSAWLPGRAVTLQWAPHLVSVDEVHVGPAHCPAISSLHRLLSSKSIMHFVLPFHTLDWWLCFIYTFLQKLKINSLPNLWMYLHLHPYKPSHKPSWNISHLKQIRTTHVKQ